MSRIYISSSWRNEEHQRLVEELRKRGHKVYDFRHPQGREDSNVWETVSASLHLSASYHSGNLYPEDFRRMLLSDEAKERFIEHFNAMQDADTCILLLPCGSSSHSEAGYMNGLGKRVFIMDTREKAVPELMYLMYDNYFFRKEDLYEALAEPFSGVCRVCGCTHENPCYHPEYDTCDWVEPDLCSHCASVEEGGYGIKDDPETEHCINDRGDAFK